MPRAGGALAVPGQPTIPFSDSAPAVASGTPFTPNALLDSTVLVPVTLAGTVTVTTGPVTGAENVLFAAGTPVALGPFTFRVKAGYKVVMTFVTATFGQVRVTTP